MLEMDETEGERGRRVFARRDKVARCDGGKLRRRGSSRLLMPTINYDAMQNLKKKILRADFTFPSVTLRMSCLKIHPRRTL